MCNMSSTDKQTDLNYNLFNQQVKKYYKTIQKKKKLKITSFNIIPKLIYDSFRNNWIIHNI